MNFSTAEVRNFLDRKRQWFLIIAYGLFLIVGIAICSDYGVSWDELSQDAYGRRNIEFILEGRPFPEGWDAVYYGPVFSSTAYALASLISPHEDRTHFLVVHFITFLYFYTSVVFFFRLAKSYLGSDYWALLAAALLVTSPRIFADSFYNPKDIPFLSAMIIGFFTMQRFLESNGLMDWDS
ncbi:MAG: glycosyltransferase family 39 protein [Deltaproteobacteria bacterium]|nr:glycosyltransferase family 39 protein [Deltaproteobacteria bacterium]